MRQALELRLQNNNKGGLCGKEVQFDEASDVEKRERIVQ
jgi:hypothetical protein